MESQPQSSFSRHHAIVTGGGSGIGAAIAEALAQRGAKISLIGRNAERLQTTAQRIHSAYGVKTAIQTADITDETTIKAAIGRLRDTAGPPSILINNAGMGVSAPFLKSDAAFWRKVINTDLIGAVFCAQAVLPAMLEVKWGRIINVASTAGLAGYAYITAYCAAKHGLVGLTRALAMETARTGVTVNAVCPSYVDTEMTNNTIENIVQKTGRSREEALSSLTSQNPQGRLIHPLEVADAVVWLCGDNSGSITGQSIAIAGGEVM